MKYFSKPLLCLLPLIATGFLAQAQLTLHDFLHRHQHHATAKTNSHEDYPTAFRDHTWNPGLSDWDIDGRYTRSYYPNGGLQEEIFENYNFGFYVNTARFTYVYDGMGNTTEYTSYSWNAAWTPQSRTTYTYDAFGNETTQWSYSWTGSAWDTTQGSRSMYTYHGIDQVDTWTLEEWDEFSNTWTPVFRIDYDYNGNNEWETLTFEFWNGVNWTPQERVTDVVWYDFELRLPQYVVNQSYSGGWNDVSRTTWTYFLNNSSISIDEEFTSTWDTVSQTIETYDAHEHETLSEYYEYVADSFVLVDGRKTHITYDGFDRAVQDSVEFYLTGDYVNAQKRVYTSFFVGASEAAVQQLSVQAYPNPVADVLHFNWESAQPEPAKVSLYDLQGCLRLETLVPAAGQGIAVPISEAVEDGMYIYRLETKAGKASGRVVVAH